jgi:hypothetical protein
VRCRLTAAVPEGLPGSRAADRHRSVCLRCQADQARQRTLVRRLGTLADDVLAAPPTLHTAVMARLGPQGVPAGASRRLRRVVGGSVAAAIGAAAVVGEVVRKRTRAAG